MNKFGRKPRPGGKKEGRSSKQDRKPYRNDDKPYKSPREKRESESGRGAQGEEGSGYKKPGRSGDFSEKRKFSGSDRKKSDRDDKRSFDRDDRKRPESGEKKPYSRDERKSDRGEKRSFGRTDKRSDGGDRKSYSRDDRSSDRGERKSFQRDDRKKFDRGDKRPFDRDDKSKFERGDRKTFKKRDDAGAGKFERPAKRSFDKGTERSFERKERRSFDKSEGGYRDKSRFDEETPRFKKEDTAEGFKEKRRSSEKKAPRKESASADGLTRLNKYLANAGIASRREADVLIKSGAVKVNGVPVTEMGFKVKAGDVVTYGDEPVKNERKVYLLLNKPKDYITTVDDERGRKTVMELIEGACRERIYPVGRLDRNTTGLLLFTNDGELTKKLTHPKYGIRKVYHVTLNKGLKPDDFRQIVEGVELEDGIMKADDLSFVGEGKKEIGIEIHSGRNRVVRRLFEQLGYDVIKLDRVVFAGLTKKDLPRGKHRFLTQKEVNFLQMMG